MGFGLLTFLGKRKRVDTAGSKPEMKVNTLVMCDLIKRCFHSRQFVLFISSLNMMVFVYQALTFVCASLAPSAVCVENQQSSGEHRSQDLKSETQQLLGENKRISQRRAWKT